MEVAAGSRYKPVCPSVRRQGGRLNCCDGISDGSDVTSLKVGEQAEQASSASMLTRGTDHFAFDRLVPSWPVCRRILCPAVVSSCPA